MATPVLAFILVAVGVLVLRRTHPNQQRPFRTPLVPWVPLGAVVCCGCLMFQLPRATWVCFGLWTAIGLVIYFCYGRHRSRLKA